MYLEYEEYAEAGGAVSEDAFAKYEMRARGIVDRMTHGRLRNETPARDCVKYAVGALIDALHADDAHEGRAVQSLSNDGVGVKYASAEPSARYDRIVREYLAGETDAAGVGLLYAGVDA